MSRPVELVETSYGRQHIELPDGRRVNVRINHGRLELSAVEGCLVVVPKASNVLEISAVDYVIADGALDAR